MAPRSWGASPARRFRDTRPSSAHAYQARGDSLATLTFRPSPRGQQRLQAATAGVSAAECQRAHRSCRRSPITNGSWRQRRRSRRGVVQVDDAHAAPLRSKSTRLFTARRNITISIGLMSVPVATMSAMRRSGSYWLQAWIRSRGFAAVTL